MNEVEDVSFLPGQSSTSKRAIYEPDGIQRCQPLICSPRRATIIVVIFITVIFLIALIAAFARSSGPLSGTCLPTTPSPSDIGKTQPTPAVATNGELFPWNDVRLPNVVIPMTYDLFLHPNLTTFQYAGNVSVLLTVMKATNCLIYHSKQLEIKSEALVRVSGSSSGDRRVEIKKHLEYINHEQIYIEFSPELSAGEIVRLNIEFSGHLTDNLVGFYRSSYETSSGEKRWLATTHFEATDARTAFPCFDEPLLKANFTLRMVRDRDYISLFNTEKIDEKDYPGNLKLDQFATSVTMSTYLVAFVVCDFKKKSGTTKSGIVVSVYAPAEMLDQTDYALNVSRKVLDFYEDYYGIKYPLKKSDHVAIPDFSAGAMENWGLVTYLMRSLLYTPDESSISDQQWVAVVVSHELAHQWFGNLVTMKWWNDLWLNEGFARFVEYLGTNYVQPDWQMPDLFIDDALSVALYSDGLSSSHPISVPVKDPAEIGAIFDAISYEKGASVIRMLETMIGKETFKAGIRDYLKTHAFGNAETDDLWTAMTVQVTKLNMSVDIKKVMDTWTLQMGYPVITVTRENNMIRAYQERFLYNPRGNITEEFKSPFGYKWHVPLTYITSADSLPNPAVIWMDKGNVSFQINKKPFIWVKMNVNMTGVYRVHYDNDNWKALITQLRTNHEVFSPADRASLISDSFALARSGHLNITVFMDLTQYLPRETEYIPWQTALSCLSYVGDLLEGQPDYDFFNSYLRQMIKDILVKLTWNDTGTHVTRLLRASVLAEALKLGMQDNVKTVRELFKNWTERNIPVNVNLRTLVYTGGIKYGGDAEWDAVWKQFLVTRTPSEKSKLLMALTATTDSIRITRFLQLSLDEAKVRSAETPSVIQAIASNPAGRIFAWRFVRANWDILYARYHTVQMKMKRLIVGVAGHFTTQFDYDEVKTFFHQHLGGENLRSVSQALDKIEMNIDWLARNKETIINWLKKH